MKYVLGALWLILALVFASKTGGRRLFGYLGPIIALGHAGALAGGLLHQRMFRRSVEGGVSLAGFLLGLCAGIIVGAALGGLAVRNTAIYWIAQIAAAAFIMFLPLFRV